MGMIIEKSIQIGKSNSRPFGRGRFRKGKILDHLRPTIRPRDEDWRSPHEKAEADEVLAAYETREFEDSVAYLKRIGVV